MGEKSKFAVPLDESLIPVRQVGKFRDHLYVEKGEKERKNYLNPTKEIFAKHFMIVGAMCQSRTFPLIKVPSKV